MLCDIMCSMKKIFKQIYVYLIILVVLSLLFICVIDSPFEEYIKRIDINIFNLFKNIDLLFIMKVFTFIGEGYIPVFIILLLLLFKKDKKYTYILSIGYIFSAVFTYLLKLIIARARPVFSIIDIPASYSFPSGHTLTSIVFFVLLAYLLSIDKSKKYRIVVISISVLVALMISFSRIYLGVHFVSDVIGGVILSIPCVLIFIKIMNIIYKEEAK